MSLRKNTIANYLGQSVAAIAGLAFVPVYVDRLGVAAYGLIGFYAVLQSWFSLLDLGMTPTITRETARFSAGLLTAESIKTLIRSFELIVFSFASIIAIGLWLASGPIATHWLKSDALSQETISGAISVISLVIATRFCEGIYRGVLIGFERQVFYNVIFSILATVRYVGAAIVVTFIPSINAFFWWQALLSFVSVCVLGWGAYAVLPRVSATRSFSLDAVRGVGGFAAGMSLTALFALVFTQLDKIILTRLVDLESFGLYVLALALSGIFPMLAGPAASAFFPRLSAVVAAVDTEAERQLFRLGTQIVSMLTVPAVAVCVLLGNEVVLAWTGDAELAKKVGQILGFIAVGAFCNAVLQIPFMLQLAHGWTTLSVRINIFGAVLLGPMIYFGTEIWGLVGAAAAWGITNIVVLFIATTAMHQRILKNESGRFICQVLVLPLIASCSVVLLLIFFVQGPTDGRLESLVIVFSSGVLALLAAMAALPNGRKLLKRLVQ